LFCHEIDHDFTSERGVVLNIKEMAEASRGRFIYKNRSNRPPLKALRK
jgi:hypothetical protein